VSVADNATSGDLRDTMVISGGWRDAWFLVVGVTWLLVVGGVTHGYDWWVA